MYKPILGSNTYFEILADWAPTAPPCSPFGSKELFGTDTFPYFLYIKLYRGHKFVWDRHLFGTDICLGQTSVWDRHT